MANNPHLYDKLAGNIKNNVAIFNDIAIKRIKEPPYDYDLMITLDSDNCHSYLRQIYKQNMNGKTLNLYSPERFSEKIQWLKLYDNLPEKSTLTDKLKVRDYVKEKIGEQYLKPVLQVANSFDEIDFNSLPETFVMKCTHGSKWQNIVKSKKGLLEHKVIFDIVHDQFNGWLTHEFMPFSAFEMQYKFIEPKILIEPLLRENINEMPAEYEIYCFNGKPKIFQKVRYGQNKEATVYDENFNIMNLKFSSDYNLKNEEADNYIKEAVELSKKLVGDFKLVRIDWLLYKGQLYFNEMTFTPFSGFYNFEDDKWDKKLGDLLNLE
ncbi:hypothetical protein IJ182_01320 [bacterium]|nr:hypothetical protein [bacterium]